MSLVNQMLKDLERRRAQLPPGDSLGGLQATPACTPPKRRWPAVLVVGGLCSVGLWAAYSAATSPAPVETAGRVIEIPAPTPRPAALADAGDVSDRPAEIDAVRHRTGPAEMNTAVSVAALEETRETAPAPSAPRPQAGRPAAPTPSQAATASEPAPAAATGVVHKTVRAPDPQIVATQHYAAAIARLRDGDQAGAEAALHEALLAVPGHGDAAQALAALLVQQGRGSAAEMLLADALAANPRQPALVLLRARLLADAGRDRAATALLEHRDDVESLALLGALQQRLGDDAAAARTYRRALARAPQQGAWWLGLAISLERTREPAAALDAYRRALADARLDARVDAYVRARIAALGDGRG